MVIVTTGIFEITWCKEKTAMRFTKFIFAYNKLKEAGKIKSEMSISDLQQGSECRGDRSARHVRL